MLALVDSRATYNFVRVVIARKLGLSLSHTNSILKTVNLEASDSYGLVKEATLCMDRWMGSRHFLAFNLDDFEVNLGNEFLKKAKV